MRKMYVNPEVEMIEFDTRDVITTSGNLNDGVAGDLGEANADDNYSPFY